MIEFFTHSFGGGVFESKLYSIILVLFLLEPPPRRDAADRIGAGEQTFKYFGYENNYFGYGMDFILHGGGAYRRVIEFGILGGSVGFYRLFEVSIHQREKIA